MRRAAALAVLLAAAAQAQSARGMVTETVRFERGETGVTLDRGVDPGQTVRYLVDVRAGQTMTVDLDNNAEGGSAAVQVHAPGRAIVARNAAPSSGGARHDLVYWTGRLARSGLYQVVVYPVPPARGANYGADYYVTFTVE